MAYHIVTMQNSFQTHRRRFWTTEMREHLAHIFEKEIQEERIDSQTIWKTVRKDEQIRTYCKGLSRSTITKKVYDRIRAFRK